MAIPAALVASHGPFVWGVSIEAAVENAVVLEDVAASSYRSIGLAGNIESIAEPLLAKHFERKHGAAAYYGQPA
jgi:L-ribulose-5-phosphate 4-epimerase